MNQWINLGALGKIIVGGLIFGAGLPAVFALGLRALHMGGARTPVAAGATGSQPVDTATGGDNVVGGNPLGMVIAGICFLVVLGAVAWGIYLIAAA